MKRNNENRFLAKFMLEKLEPEVGKTSLDELEEFFNQNGWVLYDRETMIRKFVLWKSRDLNEV